MAKVRFYTFSAGSNGMKELKNELKNRGHNALALKVGNSRFNGGSQYHIINWGFERDPSFPSGGMLNSPTAIGLARNKRAFFIHMRRNNFDRIPMFATSQSEAALLFSQFNKVYCRTELSGHGGVGIVVAHNVDELVPAPLYTSGIPFGREFRVHVFRGEIIDVVKKSALLEEHRQERGIELNLEVRNVAGGWIYAREGIEISTLVKETAIQAVNACGLDFGAVDIIVKRDGEPFVLEINTAPGITNTTVTRYADAMERWINS